MKIRGREGTSVEIVTTDYKDIEIRTYGPVTYGEPGFDWCALTPSQARKVASALLKMAEESAKELGR